MDILVVNKYHNTQGGEYIGRGSPLGNPFSSKQGTKARFVSKSRDASIDDFAIHLNERIKAKDPVILAELTRLYNLATNAPLQLVCFCAPKRCHGDVIRDVLLKAHAKQTP